jgi:hypothetical protein
MATIYVKESQAVLKKNLAYKRTKKKLRFFLKTKAGVDLE